MIPNTVCSQKMLEVGFKLDTVVAPKELLSGSNGQKNSTCGYQGVATPRRRSQGFVTRSFPKNVVHDEPKEPVRGRLIGSSLPTPSLRQHQHLLPT